MATAKSDQTSPIAADGQPETKDSVNDSVALEQVGVSDVGRRARQGALWSVLQIMGRHALSLGSTAVLARLISPDDYGLVGMVTTLTALLLVFSDMGLSWATIQRRQLSEAQISNLFWLNTVAGFVLWLSCIILAPLVATFYGRAELREVTIVLGASFVLGGVAVQPFALLTRSMKFRRIAEIEIASLAVSAVTGIYCAFNGFGYWALVVQALVGQGMRLLLVIFSAKFPLQRPRWGVGTLDLVGFGGLLALNGLLIYFARNLDNVLIGKYWGTAQLGYYNRAYFLMLLPSMLATGVLTNLMVPSLSAFQNDIARFGSAYRRAVRLVAFVGCPIAVGLALTAPEAVRLVYGEKWAPVVPMLLWLSIAGITQPIYNTTGWLFTAAGKGRLYFAVTVVNCAVLALTFFAAVQLGAVAVAMGYGLVMGLLLLWPALYLAHRAASLNLLDTVKSLAPVFLSVGVMATAVFFAGLVSSGFDLAWQIVLTIKVVVGLFFYVLVSGILLGKMLVEDVFSMLPQSLANKAGRFFRATA